MALAITAAPQVLGQMRPQTQDRRRRGRRSRNKGRFLSRAVRERNTTTGSGWWQPSRAIPKIKSCRSAAKAAAIREELDDFQPAEQAAVIGYTEPAEQYDRERELDEFYELVKTTATLERKRATRLSCPRYYADQVADLVTDPELGCAAYAIELLERSAFEHLAA
jgi:hypothetical protein